MAEISPHPPDDNPEHDGATEKLWRRLVNIEIETDWRLIVLAAILGSITAVGAVLFVAMMEGGLNLMERLARGEGSFTIPWWLILAAPIAGAAICAIFVNYGAPEAKGHGVPEVMIALYRDKGRIRPRVGVFKTLASVVTIGSGGSAGAEGPIVQIGSAIGSNIGQWLRIGSVNTSTLVGCGAAAGIASVFNAPIAGIFFALEILLRDFSIRTFTPIVVASVFSTAMTQALAPHESGAIFQVFGELEQYHFQYFELPYYFVLGLVCGLAAVSFTLSLDWTERFYDRLRIHPALKPITGGVALWILGVGTIAVAQTQGFERLIPPYYGNGYQFITTCLSAEFYVAMAEHPIMLGLLAVFVLKIIATCLTLGSGASGGVFAPSLMIGATAGGALGLVVTGLGLPGSAELSPAAFALVGMAAVVAGATHAPLAAMLMLFELTGDYQVILPIMLAAVVATFVAQLIHRESIYTSKLGRRGIRVGSARDMTLLRRITVSQVPLTKATLVRPEDPAQRLLDLAVVRQVADFVVVDENERYVGMVSGEDLRTALVQIDVMPLLVVEDLLRTDVPTTTFEETLDIVMGKFSRNEVSSLAVIDHEDTGRVLGVITRNRMIQQYHRILHRG